MRTLNQIRRAAAFVGSLQSAGVERLHALCAAIGQAEEELNRAAAAMFDDCSRRCRGLCCRNIHPAEIITLLDYIFVLTVRRSLSNHLEACARRETFFTGNCVFLQNGAGPCLFGPNAKPERCILTFCCDTRPVRAQIRMVRKQFTRLQRFVLWQRVRSCILKPRRARRARS